MNIVKAFDEAGLPSDPDGQLVDGRRHGGGATSNKDWVSTWQSSGFGIGEVNQTSRPRSPSGATSIKTALGTDKYDSSPPRVQLGGRAQDWFTIFKAAVEANHTTDGPTLAKWIESTKHTGSLRADYTFTPERHNGFVAADVGWAQPGTLKDGFNDAAQGG